MTHSYLVLFFVWLLGFVVYMSMTNTWRQMDDTEQREHEEEIAQDFEETRLDKWLGWWKELERWKHDGHDEV